MQQDEVAGIGRAGTWGRKEAQSMDKTKELLAFSAIAQLSPLNSSQVTLPKAAPAACSLRALTSTGPGPVQGGVYIFNILEAYHSKSVCSL